MGLPVKAGGQRSITIGGHTFDWDPQNNANDVLLVGYGAGTLKYTTFRQMSQITGYQVGVGKTLTIVAMKIVQMSNTVVGGANCGYGDNDVGINGTATPPTNAVWNMGSAGFFAASIAAGYGAIAEIGGLKWEVAATKFPQCATPGGTGDQAVVYAYAKVK